MVFIPIDPVPTAKPVVFHCRIFAVPAITGPLNLGPLLALRTLNTRNNRTPTKTSERITPTVKTTHAVGVKDEPVLPRLNARYTAFIGRA
jgi:hypothetical protein